MKVLTVCQPYATLIVMGRKLVENRTWPTYWRGPLGIHAGKSRSWLDGYDAADDEEARAFSTMPFGALLGIVTLDDCVAVDDIEAWATRRKRPELVGHEHVEGPVCWVMSEPHRLVEPIPMKGAQGLWGCNDDVLAGHDLVPVRQMGAR